MSFNIQNIFSTTVLVTKIKLQLEMDPFISNSYYWMIIDIICRISIVKRKETQTHVLNTNTDLTRNIKAFSTLRLILS